MCPYLQGYTGRVQTLGRGAMSTFLVPHVQGVVQETRGLERRGELTAEFVSSVKCTRCGMLGNFNNFSRTHLKREYERQLGFNRSLYKPLLCAACVKDGCVAIMKDQQDNRPDSVCSVCSKVFPNTEASGSQMSNTTRSRKCATCAHASKEHRRALRRSLGFDSHSSCAPCLREYWTWPCVCS